MDAFVNVFRKDPKVRIKINDTLDRYMKLPYNYQSKTSYDCLIHNNILEELTILLGTTITDLDIELKKKNSRVKNLENRLL